MPMWKGVIVAVVAVGFAICLTLYQRYRNYEKQLPPHSPTTRWESLMRIGFGVESVLNQYAMSKWVADMTNQDVSKGATFGLCYAPCHMLCGRHFKHNVIPKRK